MIYEELRRYFRTLWLALCGSDRLFFGDGNQSLIATDYWCDLLRKLDEQAARIQKYENRAAGQRAAVARRAAAQQPVTQSEGATPAAPQSLAQE